LDRLQRGGFDRAAVPRYPGASFKIYFKSHLDVLPQRQGNVSEIALEVIRPDESHMPVLANFFPVCDSSGEPKFVRIAIFDATGRRAYERELVAAKLAAERELQELRDRIQSDRRELVSAHVDRTTLPGQ
jgi:hypothetical protein